MDRFPEDTAPTFCLPIDDIGARHLGMTGARSLGIAHSTTIPFASINKISLMFKIRVADDPADQKAGKETRFPAY